MVFALICSDLFYSVIASVSSLSFESHFFTVGGREMVLRRAAAECPKKVAGLMDLVNLPTQLREFAGGRSQMSHISFFLRVWSYIKDNKLQVLLLPMYSMRIAIDWAPSFLSNL